MKDDEKFKYYLEECCSDISDDSMVLTRVNALTLQPQAALMYPEVTVQKQGHDPGRLGPQAWFWIATACRHRRGNVLSLPICRTFMRYALRQVLFLLQKLPYPGRHRPSIIEVIQNHRSA